MRMSRPAALVAVTTALLAAGGGDALASPTTFSYTGAAQTYTVPAHVHFLTTTAVGAGGGSTSYGGGRGVTVTSTVPVTPDSTLYVYVGGTGAYGASRAGGFNGGGNASGYNYGSSGGGASDIRTVTDDLTTRLVVAGGGGGGGSGYNVAAYGGNAGFPNGSAGGGNNSYGNGGGGGTQTAGGGGGWSSVGGNGGSGTFGQGGSAGLYFYPPYYGGGAGGGGYYGGGGGGSFAAGGGGSSYAVPDATGTTYGLASSAASVSITPQPVLVDADAYDFGDTVVDSQSSHTFTLTNTSGTAQQLSFGTEGPFGTDANGQSTCDSGTLAPGATCTIVAVFQPGSDGGALGARSGALLVDVAGWPTQRVPLTGTAVPVPVAPAAPAVTSGPQGPVTSTTATFEFSGEAGATFTCSLDGGAFVACTSPQTYTGLSAGQHTFTLRQTDAAGLTSPDATQTFTVGASSTPGPDASTLKLVVARTGTISRGHVPVGCRIDAGRLASCAVAAYAGTLPVGSGSARFTGGLLGSVSVNLTARGRALVHRVGGVKLTYRATAKTADGKTLRATNASRVLPLTVAAIPSDGLFASGSATVNAYGRRFVRTLAGQLAGAKHLRCTGNTDSVDSVAFNQRLGMARAKAVCAQLHSAGVTATRAVRSSGERHPRATNGTVAGRALNRRVVLLVRYR